MMIGTGRCHICIMIRMVTYVYDDTNWVLSRMYVLSRTYMMIGTGCCHICIMIHVVTYIYDDHSV